MFHGHERALQRILFFCCHCKFLVMFSPNWQSQRTDHGKYMRGFENHHLLELFGALKSAWSLVFLTSEVQRSNVCKLKACHGKPFLLNLCFLKEYGLSVQSFSHVRLFATPWAAAHQASLSITNSQRLLKPMSIKSVMPSNQLILCHPLLLLPSIFPSIRVFSTESVLCIRWPKCWSFSFSISPSNEYSGLISFRMGWFDPFAVQWTIRSLL